MEHDRLSPDMLLQAIRQAGSPQYLWILQRNVRSHKQHE